MKFSKQTNDYFNAGYAMVAVETHEEDRVMMEIKQINDHRSTKEKATIYEWDCSSGLRGLEGAKLDFDVKMDDDPTDTGTFLKMVDDLLDNKKFTNFRIFVIKDFHLQLQKSPINTVYIRAIRNMLARMRFKNFMFLFISPTFAVPNELQKEVQVIDFPLPDIDDTKASLSFILKGAKVEKHIPQDSETFQRSADAAKGMTMNEMENAFALALVKSSPKYGQAFVDAVFEEKIRQLKKNGLLEHIKCDVTFEDIGGLLGVKNWITLRAKAYSDLARKFGVPIPKGVLLAGLPGGGKSLTAKAIARVLGCPLFKLDLGGLFASLVGDTEANFRRVMGIIDSLGLCVIWIDEVEKYLNENAVEGAGDSGTSSRSFGSFLTWLNDRTSHAFMAMTSNDHTILPAALVRKGRLDEMFWIDLPDVHDRLEIFQVVIKKYERDVNEFDPKVLAQRTDLFSGAEIEEVVKQGLYRAFSEGSELNQKHLEFEIEQSKPFAKYHPEKIAEMRNKAKDKLKVASVSGEPEDLNTALLTLQNDKTK